MSSRLEGAKNQVLFVCIENSSRSVMAEGFARAFGMEASSAGTVPSTHVNQLVTEAMREVGIDVSKSRPKELNGRMIEDAGLVVLTDASLESAIPGDLRKRMRKKVVRWDLSDPQGKSMEEIRYIRDEIERMVRALAKAHSTTDP